MGQNKNKIKTILSGACALCFACMPLSLAVSSKHIDTAFAATASDISNITISNNNFDSSSTSSLQSSPTGWSKIGKTTNAKMGIITTEEENFSNNRSNYGLEVGQNPGKSGTTSSDNHVLMINAQSSYTNAGYESSTASTLKANSYFIASVNVKTTSSSFASVYLDGLVEEPDEDTSFEEVNFQQWTNLFFFVKTGATSKETKLQMWLGSKENTSTSAVFFDNIDFFETSESTYMSLLNNKIQENSTVSDDLKTYRQIDLTGDYVDITSQIPNANFENPAVDVFTPVYETSAGFVNTKQNQKYSNLSDNNEFAFYIKNETKTKSCYEVKDIVIPAYGIYELSIDAKVITPLQGGSAKLKIVENDEIKDTYSSYNPTTAEININATTNVVKNDFNTYTFFIKGNGLSSTKINLQIELGNDEAEISGEIALDNITFRSIDSEVLSKSSGDTKKTVELNLSSSSPMITNGHFNNYDVTSPVRFDTFGNPIFNFPYTVKSWTHSVDPNCNEDNYSFGIINTKQEYFNTSIGTANPQNPNYNIVDPDTLTQNSNSNNMLMFKNNSSTYQSATSTEFSLSSSKIYKLSFDCKTQVDVGNLGFELISGGKTISSFDEIQTNGEWKHYTVAIRTGATTQPLTAKFNFGTKQQNAIGFGFIDNVRLVETTLSEQAFLDLKNEQNTRIVDFDKGAWNITSPSSNEFGVFDLLTATSTLAEGAFAGVINGTINAFEVTSSKTENNNMLIVANTQNGTSSITTSNDINLEADKYYKISADVLTQRITDINNKDLEYGASLKIGEFETVFNKIITNGEFKTYSFVIKATEAGNYGLTLSMLSPTHDTLGTVIADNLVVNELTSVEYDEFVANKDSDSLTKVVETTQTSTDDEDTTEDTANPGLTSNEIWLLVPSVIFGVTIIVAIIMFALRRIKIKKFEKLTESSYNRTSTLDREKARIEAKKNIDKQIAEQKELQTIVETELKDLEEKYQKDLHEFRSSNSNKSGKMEKEFKSYMSEKSKLDATLNSIKDKIKNLENPELLVMEEKRIYLKAQKEKERVKRHVKKETKKINKSKKNQKN